VGCWSLVPWMVAAASVKPAITVIIAEVNRPSPDATLTPTQYRVGDQTAPVRNQIAVDAHEGCWITAAAVANEPSINRVSLHQNTSSDTAGHSIPLGNPKGNLSPKAIGPRWIAARWRSDSPPSHAPSPPRVPASPTER
jgi:hypothetical protein